MHRVWNLLWDWIFFFPHLFVAHRGSRILFSSLVILPFHISPLVHFSTNEHIPMVKTRLHYPQCCFCFPEPGQKLLFVSSSSEKSEWGARPRTQKWPGLTAVWCVTGWHSFPGLLYLLPYTRYTTETPHSHHTNPSLTPQTARSHQTSPTFN